MNFEVIFRGYATGSEMSWRDPDMLQTLHFHIPVRKWQFGGAVPPTLGLQWNLPKITKNTINAMFWPSYPIGWACVVKIICIYVLNKFWDIPKQKVLIIFFFRFCLKIDDFSENFFKDPEIHLFELKNPVGWVPHVVLAQN